MQRSEFPATIARGAMRLLPPPLLGAGTALLLRRMGRVHPVLFRELAALPPAILRIEPIDLPHRFVLRLGGGVSPRLTLGGDGDPPAGARITGRLEALIALLEGRIDSDTLFFSRAITITGDTAVVVGLRNTLERDVIDLMAEAGGLLGPLAGPAKVAARRLEALAVRTRARLLAAHAALHHAAPAAAPLATPEIIALRTEVSRLASRLARLERKQPHKPEDRAA